MRGLLQVLKTNCIRQPQRKLPTLSFNHYTLTTLEHPWGIHLLAIRAWKLLTATLKCIVITLQMFWGLTVHCGCNRNWAASSWTISPQSKSITTVSPVCLQPGKPPCGLNTGGGGGGGGWAFHNLVLAQVWVSLTVVMQNVSEPHNMSDSHNLIASVNWVSLTTIAITHTWVITVVWGSLTLELFPYCEVHSQFMLAKVVRLNHSYGSLTLIM